MIEVDCRKLDVDHHALLQSLACYVDVPELRGELGTPAALVRVRRG